MAIPLLIFAGQSNAVGASTSVHELPPDSPLREAQRNVLFWGPTSDTPSPSWDRLRPPTEVSATVTGPKSGAGFGPEISAAGRVSEVVYGGEAVAAVKFAVNGSNLYHEWNPADPASYFAAMVARARAAIAAMPDQVIGAAPQVAGFFWMQGESDTGDAATAHAYFDNLANLIRNVRSTFAAHDLPVVLGQIAHAGAFTETVRAQQARAAAELPRVGLAVTDDIPRSAYDNDTIHFGTAGTVTLGERFAEVFARLASPAGPEQAQNTPPSRREVGHAAVRPSHARP
jgi:hypothetical protein